MMPGPKEFRQDIRQARHHVWAKLALILLTGCGFILAIPFFIGEEWIVAAVMTAIAVVSVLVLVCIDRREKRMRREAMQYYTLPLPHALDYETVCAAVCAASGVQWTQVCDENAKACRIGGTLSWRILLLHQPDFSRTAYKAQRERANRALNRVHPALQKVSQLEVSSMVRINLVVCGAMNEELSRYSSTHAQRLLMRNECIVNMAVVGDCLLVPPVRGADVAIPDLTRYERSIDLIWSQLCRLSAESKMN